MSTPKYAPRWFVQRLFRKKNHAVLLMLLGVAFVVLGGPQRMANWAVERKCAKACGTYMRGLPGARWVAEYGDGPGYSALLVCMNDSMRMQKSFDCWAARMQACTQACAADKPPLFQRK